MTPAKLDFEVPAHLQRDFVFQTAGILPPNGLFFGYKTIRKLGEVAAKMGAKQALLVTDETMVQLGYAELAKELLKRKKSEWRCMERSSPSLTSKPPKPSTR
jgi:alcohol dehydrogenase class IV